MPNVLLDNMFVVKVDVEYVVQWTNLFMKVDLEYDAEFL